MINKLLVWFYKKQGYIFDHTKRMLYKSRSECHNAITSTKVLMNGKPLEHEYRWYVNKEGTALRKGYKDTQYQYCDVCGKQAKLVWKFKHLGGL